MEFIEVIKKLKKVCNNCNVCKAYIFCSLFESAPKDMDIKNIEKNLNKLIKIKL